MARIKKHIPLGHVVCDVAMGQNPNRTPSEHPNSTTKIGSKMGGALKTPKMGSQNGFEPWPCATTGGLPPDWRVLGREESGSAGTGSSREPGAGAETCGSKPFWDPILG